MTDSGLRGITYDAQPQRIDMEKNSTAESRINLSLVQQGTMNNMPIRLNQYAIMIKTSVPEKDQLFVSLLYPMLVSLNLPSLSQERQQEEEDNKQSSEADQSGFIQDSSLRSIVRNVALSAAVGLIGYIIYVKIKSRRAKSSNRV